MRAAASGHPIQLARQAKLLAAPDAARKCIGADLKRDGEAPATDCFTRSKQLPAAEPRPTPSVSRHACLAKAAGGVQPACK